MPHRLIVAVIAVAALVFFPGCSESACEKAESAGKSSHACYVENREAERELRESEDDLKETKYGSLEAAEEAEQHEQIEGEVEEVEDVLKERQAEETANRIEGR